MANGSFQTSKTSSVGAEYPSRVVCTWSSVNDTADNSSVLFWELSGESDGTSKTKYTLTAPVTLQINGETVYTTKTRFEMRKGAVFASGSLRVQHDSTGLKSVPVSLEAAIYKKTVNCTYAGSVTLTPNPVFSLNITEGFGAHIDVSRTFCSGSGGNGSLSAGAQKLCYGDRLKITFTPDTNYGIDTHTVNGVAFTSGNTYTVTGPVSVVVTASQLMSSVVATDASIGSITTIFVTRYNDAYTHTISYSFESLSGVILERSTETTIPWEIPTAFYDMIPSSKTGMCTITCTTYNGDIAIGSVDYHITVTAAEHLCLPTISASIVDENAVTSALTGNPSVLVRYQSLAVCHIETAAKNGAQIVSVTMNGNPIADGDLIEEAAAGSYVFRVVDSRGYEANQTLNPTMIAYIPVTINAVIDRPTPTGSELLLTADGNYYNGSFGTQSNSLRIRYRYRFTTDPTFTMDWKYLDMTTCAIVEDHYAINGALLNDQFDYTKTYVFEIQAIDGTEGYPLSDDTATVPVKRGIPIFDWGEDDFNFNVPVLLNGVDIRDVMDNKIAESNANADDETIILTCMGYAAGTSVTYPDGLTTDTLMDAMPIGNVRVRITNGDEVTTCPLISYYESPMALNCIFTKCIYNPYTLTHPHSLVFYIYYDTTTKAVTSISLASSSTLAHPSIYITSEYNSGIWRVRRWSNNEVELWGRYTATVDIKTAWVSNVMYYAPDAIPSQNFPVTFSTIPFVQVTPASVENAYILCTGSSGSNTTTTQTGTWQVCSPYGRNGQGIDVSFYVRGTV